MPGYRSSVQNHFADGPSPDLPPMPRNDSARHMPLPPTPSDERRWSPPSQRRNNDHSDGYSELGGYRREDTRNDQRGYGQQQSNQQHQSPGWHYLQHSAPRYHREDTRPPKHFLDDRYERDNYFDRHSPAQYKHQSRYDKRYRKKERRECVNPLEVCSNKIVGALEAAFYKLGYNVGKYPWVPIILTLLVSFACGSGVYKLTTESDGIKLWVPAGSLGQQDRILSDEYFPGNSLRFNTLIVTADNILSTKSIQAMANIHEKIINIDKNNTEGNIDAVCFKLGNKCMIRGVLELWSFDLPTIRALTQDQILDKVNTVTRSPLYNIDFNITKYVANIKRNAGGDITGAEAAQMQFVLRHDPTVINGTPAIEAMEEWESGFLKVGEEGHSDLTVYRYAHRSRRDEGFGAIFGDITLLTFGYVVVIIFVTAVLGRFNRIEHKIFVALSGILCIVLALGAAIGLGSYANLIYSPLNSILPFLILGLGVDDMFVAVSALDNLKPEEKDLPIPERMGLALKSAGVSITVTSLTDMLAFGVGISTESVREI